MKYVFKYVFLFFSFLFLGATPALALPQINEFLAHPSSESAEWVEFYNPDGVDLSGYWIDDDLSFAEDSGNTNKKSLATLSSPTQKYAYFILSANMFNNSGDYVVLFSSSGTLIDQYRYTSDPGENVVVGRNPDGADNWAVGLTASQGGPNPEQALSPTPTPSPSPSPSPSPTPDSSPSPSPSPKPSPTPSTSLRTSPSPKVLGTAKTATPTPSPVPTPTPKEDKLVLGQTTTASPSPQAQPTSRFGGNTYLAFGLMGLGLVLIVFSAYTFLKPRRSDTMTIDNG